ncbi:MAG TPA: thioesterase family protein [Kofleriaceae bacterium]
MASLTDVITPRLAGDRYQLHVSDGWRQGRGTFGGLVVGALVSAIEHHVADPARKVRTVTAELPGPVEPGTVEIAVDTLRRGNNVSTVRAALSQHGEIRSHAVAVVAAARTGTSGAASWNDLSRPAVPPWTEVAPLSLTGRRGAPEFVQNFEFRVVDGVPWSSATRALGWVRSLDPGAQRGAAYVAAMIDAWWPVGLIRLYAAGPMVVTIAFTLDLCGGLDGLDPDAPLLYHATAPVCSDGYVLETRQLWGEDGRLVAVNHQTFVVVG